MTEKRNQNGKQYVYTEEMIPFDVNCNCFLSYRIMH